MCHLVLCLNHSITCSRLALGPPATYGRISQTVTILRNLKVGNVIPICVGVRHDCHGISTKFPHHQCQLDVWSLIPLGRGVVSTPASDRARLMCGSVCAVSPTSVQRGTRFMGRHSNDRRLRQPTSNLTRPSNSPTYILNSAVAAGRQENAPNGIFHEGSRCLACQ